MYKALISKQKSISVTGLGYVGLPLALALAEHFRVIGYDHRPDRIALMQQGIDPSEELSQEAFWGKDIRFTCEAADLRQAHFHIIAVPTPVDEHRIPDLGPLMGASKSVGQALKAGDYVVYESTVYPGCTEEDCLPILLEISGLAPGAFKLAYSPERINPGDKHKTLQQITKVVSAQEPESLDTVARVYETIIQAGVYRAPSIQVAEAAKVVENSQRDLNISFVNELSMIFDRMGIDTQEVLATAATKWNFLRFAPGLVGGHCISVDPYYLLYKSHQLGYAPQVILSGRRINDAMPGFIAKRLVQMLTQQNKTLFKSKVLILGVTFKEDVSDIRNSKVVDLVHELLDYSIQVHLSDPRAPEDTLVREYGLSLQHPLDTDYDAIIVAVAHKMYHTLTFEYFKSISKAAFILMDLKGIYTRPTKDKDFIYWRL